MRVLIIDDIEDSVKDILESCRVHGWDCELSDFDNAYRLIFEFDPDVIILDWREDADQVDEGESILNNIWHNGFRPLIVFSANASLIDLGSKLQESNMIKVISKSDEEPVIQELLNLDKFSSALKLYRDDMGKALITTLNSIENMKLQQDVEDQAVGYVLSKRTSAYFDRTYISDLPPAWVQYLCPPVNNSLCVCDIIRKKSQETDFSKVGNPEEYCMILTPSCDMDTENGRIPKVSHVLCAHCSSKEEFHGKQLVAQPSNKNVKSVVSKLNMGHNDGLVSVPGLANIIPYMTVNMKKLELISIPSIALNNVQDGENIEYVRIASISSPFREQIVWAYLQTSCRPGVPDRNTQLWAKEILTL